MLGYSRIPYAAALDGAFFRWFGSLHPTGEFPNRSLVLVGLLVIIASLFDLAQIITAMILARLLIQFVGQIIGLFVFRRRRPDAERPFKMWLYPAPAVVALIGWLYVFWSPAAKPGGWMYDILCLRDGCRRPRCVSSPGLAETGLAFFWNSHPLRG